MKSNPLITPLYWAWAVPDTYRLIYGFENRHSHPPLLVNFVYLSQENST